MVSYRYELRQGDEIVATGNISLAQDLQVGDRIELAGRTGIVRDVDPVLNSEELRLVVQLTAQDTSQSR